MLFNMFVEGCSKLLHVWFVHGANVTFVLFIFISYTVFFFESHKSVNNNTTH